MKFYFHYIERREKAVEIEADSEADAHRQFAEFAAGAKAGGADADLFAVEAGGNRLNHHPPAAARRRRK